MEWLEQDEVDGRRRVRVDEGLRSPGSCCRPASSSPRTTTSSARSWSKRLGQAGYEVNPRLQRPELREVILHRRCTALRPAPDAIVSDIRMPGGTALEILEAVRSYDWALPVVLLTAFGDRETHAEARRPRRAALLDKPFDLDELRLVVTTLVPRAEPPDGREAANRAARLLSSTPRRCSPPPTHALRRHHLSRRVPALPGAAAVREVPPPVLRRHAGGLDDVHALLPAAARGRLRLRARLTRLSPRRQALVHGAAIVLAVLGIAAGALAWGGRSCR